jgi:hypothetical protein
MLETDGPDVEAELTPFVVKVKHLVQLPLDAIYEYPFRLFHHSHHPISLSARMTSGALRIVTMMMLVTVYP